MGEKLAANLNGLADHVFRHRRWISCLQSKPGMMKKWQSASEVSGLQQHPESGCYRLRPPRQTRELPRKHLYADVASSARAECRRASPRRQKKTAEKQWAHSAGSAHAWGNVFRFNCEKRCCFDYHPVAPAVAHCKSSVLRHRAVATSRSPYGAKERSRTVFVARCRSQQGVDMPLLRQVTDHHHPQHAASTHACGGDPLLAVLGNFRSDGMMQTRNFCFRQGQLSCRLRRGNSRSSADAVSPVRMPRFQNPLFHITCQAKLRVDQLFIRLAAVSPQRQPQL